MKGMDPLEGMPALYRTVRSSVNGAIQQFGEVVVNVPIPAQGHPHGARGALPPAAAHDDTTTTTSCDLRQITTGRSLISGAPAHQMPFSSLLGSRLLALLLLACRNNLSGWSHCQEHRGGSQSSRTLYRPRAVML
jgi:hypothetical protein